MILISKNFKFCGCADLTITTAVLGAIMAVAAIINLASSDEAARFLSIWTLIFGISCAAVLFKRHNVLLRQILLGMFCFEVLTFIGMVIWFAYAMATVDQITDDLNINDNGVTDTAKTVVIVVFSIVAAVRTALLVMLGSVLFGGYKEQLAYAAQQNSTEKPASKAPATVVIAGKQVEVVGNNVDQENKVNAV